MKRPNLSLHSLYSFTVLPREALLCCLFLVRGIQAQLEPHTTAQESGALFLALFIFKSHDQSLTHTYNPIVGLPAQTCEVPKNPL